ncbi:MAG: cytochrome c [Saprospiraceae bacterium]|nr:cytochrome c [Saprospiraceae bacterium]
MNWLIRLTPVLLAGLLLACESAQDQIERQTAAAQSGRQAGGTAPDGLAVFRKYCVTCHGVDGKLALNGAKDLTKSALSLQERITQITNGKNMMTPFAEVLSPEEIKAVAEYTLSLKK